MTSGLWLPQDHASGGMVFPQTGMSISPIVQDLLYQGSAPRSGESFERFARGGKAPLVVTLLYPPAGEEHPRLVGCEHRRFELDDNAMAPVTRPPTLVGMHLWDVAQLAQRIAERMQRREPTIVCCRWGLNRSGLVVGCVLRAIQWSPERIVAVMRGQRGPAALSNPTFYAMVTATR